MEDAAVPAGQSPRAVEAQATAAEDDAERYELRWPGKAAAARRAALPSHCALDLPAGLSLEETQSHLFIEGDNLDALKLLLPAFADQIQLIYIDPPYNTGNEFIFADKYHESLRDYRRLSGVRAPSAGETSGHERLEASGRRHARWLSMLYPLLLLAHRLLREDGALCLSIGNEEVHHARLLLDEIFGERQHRNTLAVRRYDKNLTRQFMRRGLTSLAVGFEYVLIYARSEAFTMNPVFREPSPRRREHGYWKGFFNSADRPTMRYPLLGVKPERGQWKWCEAIAHAAVENYREYLERYAATMTLEEYWAHTGRLKRFIRRNPAGRGQNKGVEHWIPPSGGILRTSNWTDLLASESLEPLGLPFDNPKSRDLIEQLVRLCGREDALVLDFFAGSGTTGHAVLALNAADGGGRRFLLVQQPEPTGHPDFPTIAEIARTRLRHAIAELMPPADFMPTADAAPTTVPRLAEVRVLPPAGEHPVGDERSHRRVRSSGQVPPQMS
jgi:adenine-specific DNA-methyltransferase